MNTLRNLLNILEINLDEEDIKDIEVGLEEEHNLYYDNKPSKYNGDNIYTETFILTKVCRWLVASYYEE
jgi:hypothetical protein